LRNPGGEGTCQRCFTPTAAVPLCARCRQAKSLHATPDLLGVLTYAGYLDPIAQSGRVMRGYKNTAFGGSGSYKQTVSLLAALGLVGHIRCPGRMLGTPVSAWATVSSLPARPSPGAHPLHQIVSSLAKPGSIEVVLTPTPELVNPRDVSASHYAASAEADGRHVLIIDDTWTGGGHATSAALAAQAAGASHVSVLVLARWLAIGWEATTPTWARRHLATPDFRPAMCPWTQGACP
jgi:hypothetical protein